MRTGTAQTIFGTLYLIIWLTHTPHLYSFRPSDMQERAEAMAESHLNLPDFVRDQSPVAHLDREALEQFIHDELMALWIMSFSIIALGVLAALMMMRGWMTGGVLALGLLSYHLLLMWRTFDRPDIGLVDVAERALDLYRIKWDLYPYRTAHQMLTWVVMLVAPLLCLRRRRARGTGDVP